MHLERLAAPKVGELGTFSLAKSSPHCGGTPFYKCDFKDWGSLTAESDKRMLLDRTGEPPAAIQPLT